MLKTEISQHLQKNTNQLTINTKEKDHQNSSVTTAKPVEKAPQSIEQYPTA
jgi:hypothetical protein